MYQPLKMLPSRTDRSRSATSLDNGATSHFSCFFLCRVYTFRTVTVDVLTVSKIYGIMSLLKVKHGF